MSKIINLKIIIIMHHSCVKLAHFCGKDNLQLFWDFGIIPNIKVGQLNVLNSVLTI